MEHIETRFGQLDVLPLVKHYMKSLNLYGIFDKYVPTSSKCKVKHAEGLSVLVENIIISTRPLYKVEEWLSGYSDGVGRDPLNASSFNDDRLGRDLSALFGADRHSMMTELSANAIKEHDLLLNEIHNDTTSITLIGRYDKANVDAIKPMLGYNKDHRPDCKQIVFGLNITADGHVPLGYTAYNGNTNDDIIHIPNWDQLRLQLGKKDFIYVADCKLCNRGNLAHIHQNGGYFVTLIPKGRNEVKKFHDLLKKGPVEWKPGLLLEDSRKKGQFVTYKTYEAGKTIEGYRVVWVHSSSKEEDDRSRRQHGIDKAVEDLKELSQKLNQYHLKTKQEIEAAVSKITQSVKGLVRVKIVTERKQVKLKRKRAKSGVGMTYDYRWEFRFSLEWKVNQQAVELASKTDGIFPLITNTDMPPADVLRIYKNQPFLEKRNYTSKSVLEIAPVYLKNTDRIEAIIFLYFVSLMIVTLLERRIRMSMIKEKIEKIPILPQGMKTRTPTWNNIRYFFRNVHNSTVLIEEENVHVSVIGMTDMHWKVLDLIGVPRSTYENIGKNWWLWSGT